MTSIYILLAAILVLIFVLIKYIRIIPQSVQYVIERLGSYHATWGVGIHIMVPFIDRVHNPLVAIENLTTTTLRNIIGDLELDETLTSRDLINSKMRANLDEATNTWGIKVLRVEVKNIVPPKDIQDTMEKQMRAERERREAILKAEGEKKSAILVAEGQKQAKILEAEALKQSQILAAQAEKEATILKAEAAKEAAVRTAEGEAQAILEVQTATAKGLELINKAMPSDAALTLKALEAFAAMADGQATKIIIPSDIQGLAGLTTSITEIIQQKQVKLAKD